MVLILGLFFIPQSDLNEIRYGGRLVALKDVLKLYVGVSNSKYLNSISVLERKIINGKNVVIFDRFYENDVPRHSRAKLTAFLAKKDENELYVFIANGESFSIKKPLITSFASNVKYDVKRIKNNLKDIVTTKDFFLSNPSDRHGVKDVTIFDGYVYVAHTDKKSEENCTFAQILRSPLPTSDGLEFTKVFKTECLDLSKGQGGRAVAHMVGARIIPTTKKIFFSVGMLNNFLLPQNDQFSFGKILEIDYEHEVNIPDLASLDDTYHIAKGVRNPQGLAKCDDHLFFSSHGPKGGDEVNYIPLKSDSLPINFGWPIASYGTHYDGTFGDSAPSYAPMYQDHTKYGFQESLIHYTPSVAPSQLIALPKNNSKCDEGILLYMATMGYRDDHAQKSIHRYEVSVENGVVNVIQPSIFSIGGRIRDIENDDNVIWFWDESRGSLGYLEK